MAGAIPEDKPGGGKGPLANLSPKQKRYAAVAGVAGLLALIFMLSRRSGPPLVEETAPAPVAAPQDYSTLPAGSTFADNGAAAADLGDAVTSGLADVASELFTQGQQYGLLSTTLNEGIPAIGAGLAGQIGLLEAQVAEARQNNEALEKATGKLKPGKGGGGGKGAGKDKPGKGNQQPGSGHQHDQQPGKGSGGGKKPKAAAPAPVIQAPGGRGSHQSTLQHPGHVRKPAHRRR